MMGRPGGMARSAMGGGPGAAARADQGPARDGAAAAAPAAPRPARLVAVLVFAVTSVGFLVAGPKILGNAINVLFDGVVGQQLPAGMTQAQVIALLRAQGKGQLASMLSGMTVTPGVGVDLTRLGQLLGLAALVYLLGAALNSGQGYIMAGITQRAMYGLRRDVEDKLTRLPLRYFDSHPHGDILSRVTNDIDNLTTTIQQGLSQLLTSVLTIAGVLGVMFWISPLLATVCVVVVPLALLITFLIARRSQVQFTAQWDETGELNGLVEETHTGHTLVQAFGRRQAVIDQFGQRNRRVYEASFRAQFLSGIIQPSMQALSNLNYVVIAVIGGYWVASGRISLGDVVGVHPVLPPVHDADHADRQPDEHAAVRPGLGRAGVRVPRCGGGASRARRGRSPAGPR